MKQQQNLYRREEEQVKKMQEQINTISNLIVPSSIVPNSIIVDFNATDNKFTIYDRNKKRKISAFQRNDG